MKSVLTILTAILLLCGTVFAQAVVDEKQDEAHFDADLSLLFWQPIAGDQHYAMQDGRLLQTDYYWDTGIRAQLGFGIGSSRITPIYTHFSSEGYNVADGLLQPTLTRKGLFRKYARHASIRTFLDHNGLDLMLSSPAVANPDFDRRLNVSAGFSALWIDQRLEAFYDGCQFRDTWVNSTMHFEGYGISLGLDGTVQIGDSSVYFIADAKVTMLVSEFHRTQTETERKRWSSKRRTRVDVREDFQKIIFGLNGSLGFSFALVRTEDAVVALYIQYEVTLYVDMATLRIYSSPLVQGMSETLGLHGATLGVKVGF